MKKIIRHTIVKKLIFDDHIHFYILNVNYEMITFQLDLYPLTRTLYFQK